MAHNVLVVTGDDSRLNNLVALLNGAGYRAFGALTFAQAKQVIGTSRPDVVITDERLGDFNGLHVALIGRASRPDVKVVVVSREQDPTFESEATRLNVPCRVQPSDPSGWLEWISRTLAADRDGDPRPLVH